jgi:hypothetical protein
MLTFNELIRSALVQVDWEDLNQVEEVVDIFRFISDMMSLLARKTNGLRTSPFKAYQISWFSYLRELLQIVLHTSYPCVDSVSFTYFAKKTQEPILAIIEAIKQLFSFSKNGAEESKASSSTLVEGGASPKKKQQADQSLLEYLVSFTQEGTDFSVEKVFETPHPYPKGDYTQKETVCIHKAIGYTVEVDRRSSTEFNSDFLTIQTADHAFWVNDTFGTHIRMYGKSHHKLPLMILGNKLNLEFKAYPHSGKRA